MDRAEDKKGQEENKTETEMRGPSYSLCPFFWAVYFHARNCV